ncbi:putative enoyl-CoA hydratase EchA3 (enoyl hydrase) (unsaturated acyl-CoA hydratase) (crotonase) [Mycobacterium tuberculosis H37Rv] [Mycobacterium shimoidei]|uniref:Putative enoyl-CoA hydratase EchA3 (Enoyl hydrase) (Unsaturated acyl-CoA hydratase) (Crotonase) [Mycobacterium tuberculosis H37Rv] n=1 Tax=Mycobacterium shimoidei TaxID=29313 RepID=A0A375YTE7_MYCSH|nr:crotonase/enoyl-CoA hydratase family protein [Mycobacterium shimoidei]SRX92107.1 putative enoyl-CoA hydratase EchA3 (enoyl hydrase) (unsaturated acyl-CoA hydratase) (crotonase) [Mycobacterium tuberculosis H37Rv] [Mycobacterium shimoidei]
MSGPVSYRHEEPIAVITMDDGKVNALGPSMQQALHEALDNADRDDVSAVVITGNDRVFSGGFDLKILTSGEAQPALDMLKGGFELSHRLLSYPKPVVMACTGHAIAMGAFLLSSGDHRVAAPAYNIQANEVAIGMTIPYAALAIMELRLTPSAYQQAAGLAKMFFGETAVAAGFIDEIVLPEMVIDRALEAAHEFANLNQKAHAATKLRTREAALSRIRAGIDGLAAEFGV